MDNAKLSPFRGNPFQIRCAEAVTRYCKDYLENRDCSRIAKCRAWHSRVPPKDEVRLCKLPSAAFAKHSRGLATSRGVDAQREKVSNGMPFLLGLCGGQLEIADDTAHWAHLKMILRSSQSEERWLTASRCVNRRQASTLRS